MVHKQMELVLGIALLSTLVRKALKLLHSLHDIATHGLSHGGVINALEVVEANIVIAQLVEVNQVRVILCILLDIILH